MMDIDVKMERSVQKHKKDPTIAIAPRRRVATLPVSVVNLKPKIIVNFLKKPHPRGFVPIKDPVCIQDLFLVTVPPNMKDRYVYIYLLPKSRMQHMHIHTSCMSLINGLTYHFCPSCLFAFLPIISIVNTLQERYQMIGLVRVIPFHRQLSLPTVWKQVL